MSKHFIEGEIQEFKVNDEVYKYKNVDADDQINWMGDYIDVVTEKNDEGKEETFHVINAGKLMKCKFRNIIEAPFTKEDIKEIIGVEKEWKDLSLPEKDKVIGKMKPSLFGLIRREIERLEDHQKND